MRSNVRHHLPSTTGIHLLIDVILATLMLTYNCWASRFAISVVSAGHVAAAMQRLDQDRRLQATNTRNAVAGTARRALHGVNPFNLLNSAADRFGRVARRVSDQARRRGLTRAGRVLGELAEVNVLGVPGAAIERGSRGVSVTRRDSFRHALLFVLSWFAGAWVIEELVHRAHALPLVGSSIDRATRVVGTVFATVTDVTRPLGAVAVGLLVVAVVRYTARVERMAIQLVN